MRPIQDNQTKRPTMRLRDPISSYKCFESIATPSPIAPTDGNSNVNENRNTNLHRTASLDSLANSSEQETSEETEDDANELSDADSIPEFRQIEKRMVTSAQVHRKSDLEEMKNEPVPKEPVIKAYLEKSHRKCDYKNCGFKKKDKDQCDSGIEECKGPSNGTLSSVSSSTTTSSSSSSSKIRRTSVASSGSIGRMETIIEEPNEPKISVKEILARFETLNSLEIQSKASTLSSGARAAAQTLNVPIERLEAQVHMTQNNKVQAINDKHTHNHRDRIDSHDDEHIVEYNGKSISPNNNYHHHQQQQQQQQQSSHHASSHKNSINNGHYNGQQDDIVMHHQDDEHQMDGSPSVMKYSLLQFAMQHFRNDQITEDHPKNGRPEKRMSTASKPHSDLVKWQGTPIRTPLLRLPPDLSPLALECFDCILRYCGDLPPDPESTEVKCVYTVLMHCHKHLTLRDEVYCQLMKQTTANRSPCSDSSQRAWRLLSVLAAYFGCSDALKPYLLEHLTAAASDRRRSSHGTAAVCLTNLRKTARCGGRKNVPSVEEVTAVSAGRSARRQIYRLPGGAERVVNTRCSTVVADVIAELCSLLGIESPTEQQEFSLYCIVQGDAFTMPLAADEYILDVTTELLKSGQPFYLIFCRSVWHYQLKRDPAPTPLYIEVLFNQVAPDYLEGLLLELPSGGAPNPDVVRDMARIAALLHRAADLNHVPAMKEIKFLLPKPALGIRELRPAQWVALVQSAWPSIAGLAPAQVKAQFLNVLSNWALFGSSFFAVKRVWSEDSPAEEANPMWRDLILALNRRGILFLDPNTHETLQHWPFMEIISTRKVRSEDGALFLDMKVGNLMQQRVIRVQTEQAHEISRLIRQYITMAQIGQKDR